MYTFSFRLLVTLLFHPDATPSHEISKRSNAYKAHEQAPFEGETVACAAGAGVAEKGGDE